MLDKLKSAVAQVEASLSSASKEYQRWYACTKASLVNVEVPDFLPALQLRFLWKTRKSSATPQVVSSHDQMLGFRFVARGLS